MDGVELLNKSNYIDYNNARPIISENIYLFFNTYKTKTFPTLPSLQAELIQFRQGAKSTEYINHLMKKGHSDLIRLQRTINIINCDDKPRFKQCKDIYEFLARYRTWL